MLNRLRIANSGLPSKYFVAELSSFTTASHHWHIVNQTIIKIKNKSETEESVYGMGEGLDLGFKKTGNNQ